MATKLAHEVNLDRYQAGFDEAGKRIDQGSFKTVDLIPPGRKDCFAPGIDPSNLIEEGDFFEALSNIDWDVDNLQIAKTAKEAPGDGEAATQSDLLGKAPVGMGSDMPK